MPAVAVWAVAVATVAVIGIVDYASGAELRVFPLYFAPVSFVAWHQGRGGALILAGASTVSWALSNLLAGLTFSNGTLWVANALVQGVSFLTIGLLIARLRAAIDREQSLSRTDSVTSVLNSRAFHEEVSRQIALCRRKKRPMTIAYLDLDYFKSVNDALGHHAGDQLLRRVALLIQSSVRPGDVFARLGGDEFALMLAEAGKDDARAMLERLRTLVEGSLASDSPRVTVTIGAVTFITPPTAVEDMIRQADSQMYTGKSAGRNRLSLEDIAGTAAPYRISVNASRR